MSSTEEPGGPKARPRETEGTLRESEELYRLLAEHSTDMISKHTPEGVYTYASPACRPLLGYEPEDLVGHDAYEFFNPDDLEQIRRSHSTILERPDTYTVGYRIQRKDGSYTWFETTSRTVRDPETDEVLEIIAVSRDVTERKRAEEKLREAEAKYRTLVEQIPAVTYMDALDEVSSAIYMSPQAEDMLGTTPEEWLADPELFVKLLHPEDRERVLSEHMCANKTGAPLKLEYRLTSRDGRIVWVRDESVVVRDEEDRPLFRQGVLLDITERKQLEESLCEIREAERRRIARDLHDVVLQDLAGALQGMQAAQIESEKSGSSAGLEQEIAALQRAVEGLRNAIYDLRLEKGQPFVRAVESLVEFNRQLTPEREIRLTVHDGFPPELPDSADVELLRVLQEALVNARRHSAARHVEVVLSKNRHMARAAVADDGRGFDPASVREGVGISGMRERASALGGRLKIESAPGKGTSVKLEVPF